MGSNSKKNSSKKKLLTFALGVVVLIAIGLLASTIVLGLKLKNKSNELKEVKGDEVCITEDCVKAAGDMIKAMDQNVSPCQNFYEFACANWVKNNPIPDTSSSWNQFNVLREQLNRKIKGILEMSVSEKDPNPVILAKQYYKSCMEQNSKDETELIDLIETVLKVDEGKTNLGLKLGELRRRTGGQLLTTIYVELDEINTSNYTIYIDQPGLGLNRAYLIVENHANRIAYKDLIKQVWPIIYPPAEGSTPIDYSVLADQIVEFETKIAQVSSAPEDRRNRTDMYNLMTISEFGDHASTTMINWEEYVVEVFKDAVRLHNVELGHIPNLKVVVRDMKYFKEMGTVLSDASAADQDIIVNYLRWRIIFAFGNEVSQKLRDVFFEYTRKTQGTLYPSPRWQGCSDRTNAVFGMAISYHYVQDVFTGDFSGQMSEMITNLQASFLEIMDSIEWIQSEETRNKAKEKAKKMSEFLGYPDWLLTNNTALDVYYDGLVLSTPDNYFHNLIEVSKWKNVGSLKNIKESKDSTKWITDPTVVNAFYSSTYNSISFPGGILQPPFYFTGKPIQALNYGAIGMVIGHEITHGFDDRGRQSDSDGNLVNWWDDGTVQQYIQRAQCFIDQYSAYQVHEANNMTINGQNTLGENIADNGGLRQSFQAYQSYVKMHGQEPKLPGLKYTPEQLFFVAFAQIWCGSYTAQGMEAQIRTGVHSPNRFRVIGVLQNSQEFADTWKCPKPDAQKSCKIW